MNHVRHHHLLIEMKPSGASGLIRKLIRNVVVFAALAMGPAVLHAQVLNAGDSNRLEVTRAGLEEMLQRYEQEAQSSAINPALRQEASATAESIRVRLTEGDFRPGDQIELNVEGEPSLQGTFIVDANRAIILPVFGAMPLYGVLRSELQESLRSRLATYLIDPVVVANSSIRLMISGYVAQPGIYVVPTQQLLSSVIMESGRPGTQADLRAMRIERGDNVLWDAKRLESAIAQGYSVDQLGLRSGDHIFVPAMVEERGVTQIGRAILTGIPAVLLVISTLVQIF